MSTREKILDDLARAAGGTVGVLSDLKGQAKQTARSCVDSMAQDMDLVPREDFERLEAILEKMTLKCDKLEERVQDLEEKLAKNSGA